MATVFSVEAVAAGQIPVEGSHARAAQLVVARLGDISLSHGGTANVLIYGSAAAAPGVPDIRSDVDGVAIMEGFLADGNVVNVSRVLGDISAATYVPLDIHIITPSEVAHSSGTATGDPLFVEHLVEAQRDSHYKRGDVTVGLVSIDDYDDPCEQLYTAVDTTRGYLMHKTSKMMAAARRSELDVHDIQRGLELPGSAGRKIGRVLQIAGYIEGGVRDLMVRSDAERVFEPLIREDKRWRVARELNKLNAAYGVVLLRTLDRDLTVSGYERWLLDHRKRIFELSEILVAVARDMLEHEFC
jgi:hypothetical protein